MNIWIFNHYASTPDQPMTGAYYMARALAERGHSVRFFASSFSYYKRKELRLAGWKLSGEDEFDNIRFTWVRSTPHGASMATRFINMLSYMFVSLFVGLCKRERPDIVVGTCPHLLGVLSAMLVAKLRGSKFVYEVRDLWPQTFVDSGVLRERSLLTRGLRALERRLYQRADLIVSVLPFVNEYLRSVGVNPEKWVWIPNGIDAAGFPSLNPPARDASGRLTFMYLGGHARYQGLNTIIRAAKILQDENVSEPRFILVGDGVVKPELQKMASELQLRNVEFRDSVPRQEVPAQLSQAAVAIFHILPLPVLRFGVSPNKLCDYMVAGRPVLCAGELRNNPVDEADAGICIPSEDPQAMAEAVKKFLTMHSSELQCQGTRGRRYALQNWDCRVLAGKLELRLQALLGPSIEDSARRRAA